MTSSSLSFNQTLFYSLQQDDFSTSLMAIQNGANPNSIFPISPKLSMSCTQLCILKCAQYGYKKGPSNNLYRSCFSVLKQIISKSTIQCKCLNPSQHKCPLFIVLQIFRITTQEQILQGKCELIRYLIINGANIKFQQKQNIKAKKNVGKWGLKWIDIQGIKSYLITKQFKYVQTEVVLGKENNNGGIC